MTINAAGTFVVKTWEEKPFSEMEGGPKLNHATVVNTFSGIIEGESILNYLTIYTEPELGGFMGYERVTGKIGDKSGSFVLEHRGSFDGKGDIYATWIVVPGSATGELRGLRAEGGYVAHHGEKVTSYRLNYAFD
jgi:hypothetical protein